MAKNVKEEYTGPKVTDTDTFIQKARWVHGDKYDYSKVEYQKSTKNIVIICRKHGEFFQTPSSHVNKKAGCRKCYDNRRAAAQSFTKEDFIKRALSVHGDVYNYKQINYINSKVKIEIGCNDHGYFWQEPNSHLSGKGCPSCGIVKMSAAQRHDTKWFIEESRRVHGYKYDYSESVYVNSKTTVHIICPNHGSTYQLPFVHLRRTGCLRCGYEKLGDLKRGSSKDFINRSIETHGNRYDYSKSEYIKQGVRVTITCPKHGDFEQDPHAHIRGNGCPCCSQETASDRWNPVCAYGIRGYYGTMKLSNIYLLKINGEFLKVGLAKKISTRMKSINKESGYPVEKLYSVSGPANDLWDLEQKILRGSGLKKFYSESPFRGQSECLELSELPKVLQIIKEWEEDQKGA